MKTNLTTMLTGLFAVTMLSFSTQKSIAADSTHAERLSIKNISKINVSGNVELHINQSLTEGVIVYDTYYSNTALVQMEEGELRISAYGKEKLEIWVNVITLSSIEGSGSVTIESYNTISAIELDIQLYDHASADIKTNALDLASAINDFAQLSISGDVENNSLEISGAARVDVSDLSAKNESIEVSDEGQVLTVKNGKTVVVLAPAKA